jgi:predicted transcriptional regulator
MSTETDSNSRTITDERILEFIRTHEDPCVTAGEIAEEFDITNEGVNYRLKKIRDRGDVVEKRVGASAKVWYVSG